MSNKITQLTFVSLIVAGGLIVAAVLLTGGSSDNTASVGNDGSRNNADSAKAPTLVDSAKTPTLREFDIVLENNQYNPSVITVNLGDRVVINFTNRDNGSHAVEIPEFNATVPGGHVFPGKIARMEFTADRRIRTDVATCGGPNPTDKTDSHGEELIINVI